MANLCNFSLSLIIHEGYGCTQIYEYGTTDWKGWKLSVDNFPFDCISNEYGFLEETIKCVSCFILTINQSLSGCYYFECHFCITLMLSEIISSSAETCWAQQNFLISRQTFHSESECRRRVSFIPRHTKFNQLQHHDLLFLLIENK